MAATPSQSSAAAIPPPPEDVNIKMEVYGFLDRMSKLLDYSYIETDEVIGPQVGKFEQAQRQIELIGQELTRLRDATSATHTAHVQLAHLCEGGSGIPSVRIFGERQEGLAHLSQTLAASYDRFVSISINQLEGLAGVVANKYKAYCNKVIEMRRRKEQLQLLVKQKQRSDLRTLERSLIPQSASAFRVDLEGALLKLSPVTKLWWSCYARLDRQQGVLLFCSSRGEPPSAASKAVALSKYVLCHELPEHHAKRAAAFELVPLHPDLPFVTLSADGSLEARRWVCALQQVMDSAASSAASAASSAPSALPPSAPMTPGGTAAAPPASEASAADAAGGAADDDSTGGGANGRRSSFGPPPMPMPGAQPDPSPSPLKPLSDKFEQLYDYSSAKLDELDRQFSGTLAEQSQRTEVQLAALTEEKRQAGEQVLSALEDFSTTMTSQMADELVRISEAQLEYHVGMVAHLTQLTTSLKVRCQAAAETVDAGNASSPVATIALTAGTATPAAAARSTDDADAAAPPPTETTDAGVAPSAPSASTTAPEAPPEAPPPPPAAAAAGAAVASCCGVVGPAWTRGEVERPLGEKDMGGWVAAVYTEEQQKRLGLDEAGQPKARAATPEEASDDGELSGVPPSPSVPLSSVGAADDEIVD